MASNESDLFYEYNGEELVSSTTYVFLKGLVLLCHVLYGVAIMLGIPCNLFVFMRMCRLAVVCTDVYRDGTGMCLLTMSIADIVSLTSIAIHYLFSFHIITIDDVWHTLACKTVIFSTHVATSVSIWCWLLMSWLRYLSVYYPLLYLRLWRLPNRMLLFVICCASFTNFWLLAAVIYNPQEGCTLLHLFNSSFINRGFLFAEIFWSFCIPSAIIIFVDASVYRCRNKLTKKDSVKDEAVLVELRRNYASTNIQSSRRALWRWLVIALIDVVLNAPENLNRLGVILGLIHSSNDNEVYLLVRVFSQVLYYSQFGFNGVYLALFIYDRSTRPLRWNDKHIKKKSNVCEHCSTNDLPETPICVDNLSPPQQRAIISSNSVSPSADSDIHEGGPLTAKTAHTTDF